MLIKNEITRKYSKNKFYKVLGAYGGCNKFPKRNVEVLSNKEFDLKEKTKVKTYSKPMLHKNIK